jgi:hypothetical protein
LRKYWRRLVYVVIWIWHGTIPPLISMNIAKGVDGDLRVMKHDSLASAKAGIQMRRYFFKLDFIEISTFEKVWSFTSLLSSTCGYD